MVALRAMLAAIAVAIAAFFYRFNALGGALGGFGNDQFIHLARARQIVAGELPFRDFSDPGAPLVSGVSAFVEWLGGYNLLGEAILTAGALALGAALTVWLAARATGRVWPAVLVGVLQIAIAPRLYNYPKIVVTACAIWLCWRYVDRATWGRLALLAAWMTIAFLFRHDFLVYVGLLVALTVIFAHRRSPSLVISRLAGAAALALVLVSPFLVFLQASGGVAEYLRQASAFARADAERTTFRWPQFDTSLSAPLVALTPPANQPPPARVNIRWSPDASPQQRAEREQRYGLTGGERREGTTWNYAASDRSRATIERLVRDPLVLDTHGIDRSTFQVSGPKADTGWGAAWANVHVAPELTSRQNLVAWLYHTLMALPLVAAVAWIARARSAAFDRASMSQSAPYLWPLIGMSALLNVGFLTRGTIEARLADVAVPAGILAAWLLCPARERFHAVPLGGVAWLARTAGLVVLLASVWSIVVFGEVRQIADRSELGSAEAALIRSRVVARVLSATPPLDSITGDGETPFARAAGYIGRCTPTNSRLFVFGNLPEMYFFSGRLFAGGYSWLVPGYATTAADQQRTIDRIAAYDVPLVLTEPADVFDAEYRADFPAIVDFLDQRYREAGRLATGETGAMRVLLRRDLAWREVDGPTALPCASATSR